MRRYDTLGELLDRYVLLTELRGSIGSLYPFATVRDRCAACGAHSTRVTVSRRGKTTAEDGREICSPIQGGCGREWKGESEAVLKSELGRAPRVGDAEARMVRDLDRDDGEIEDLRALVERVPRGWRARNWRWAVWVTVCAIGAQRLAPAEIAARSVVGLGARRNLGSHGNLARVLLAISRCTDELARRCAHRLRDRESLAEIRRNFSEQSHNASAAAFHAERNRAEFRE